jgi:predicted MFS family arabinose efflux permease
MRNFGVLAVGFSVSAFCGPIIAGYLIDSAGHYASFAASFVASALLIATAFALLKWRWRFDGRAPISAPARPINARVFDLLKTPELRRLYLAIVVISSLWDLFMFLVPVQGSNIGLSASQIGFVLAAFAAATFSVRLALPLFVDRLSEWQMIGVVQVVAAGVYLVFPLVTGHYGLVALSFVLGLGLGIGQPAVMSLLHKVTPAGRIGEAVGLRMTMVNGTQTVLPTVFGSVGSLLGAFLSGGFVFAPLFWGMALVSGVSGTSALRGPRAR